MAPLTKLAFTPHEAEIVKQQRAQAKSAKAQSAVVPTQPINLPNPNPTERWAQANGK